MGLFDLPERFSKLDDLIQMVQRGEGASQIARDLAEELRSGSNLYAHAEQQVSNVNVKLLRQDGFCPVCGHEDARVSTRRRY